MQSPNIFSSHSVASNFFHYIMNIMEYKSGWNSKNNQNSKSNFRFA